MSDRRAPQIQGVFRNHIVHVPEAIAGVSGITIFGRTVKSLIFTTDVALIRNTDADAVIAVYPFTPQPAITRAVMMAADIPVFCGVGGGITTGKRVVDLARDAEFQGALGVVVNAPTADETIRETAARIDIPIVVTVVNDHTDIAARLRVGASILNVSCAARTAAVVAAIRADFPEVPIIATGGPTEDSVKATVEAGANAITFTPPTCGELFRDLMDKYRATL